MTFRLLTDDEIRDLHKVEDFEAAVFEHFEVFVGDGAGKDAHEIAREACRALALILDFDDDEGIMEGSPIGSIVEASAALAKDAGIALVARLLGVHAADVQEVAHEWEHSDEQPMTAAGFMGAVEEARRLREGLSG